jgi:hypothetical protein
MEKTHTWYGMFLEDGNRTAAVDAMTRLWTGQWPTNRCPVIEGGILAGIGSGASHSPTGAVFAAGATLEVSIRASDPESDPLRVTWDVRRDVSDDPRVGGDYEPLEPAIPNAVAESSDTRATLKLPASPGKYRIYVYVRDGHGGAATANLPVLATSP